MQVYLVGGAVRDKLLGYPVSERDWVVVGATPQQLLDRGYKAVGKDFPVFLHPDTREEYALARTERKTAPGYKGFQCYAAADVTLEDDLIRRDLTINAMAEDAAGQLVDPFGGRADIEGRWLRHVSPAFAEDPVRILRVARFAARYHHLGFRPAAETVALMRQMVARGEADHLVPERVWKEFSRALQERHPEAFIGVLQQCRALAAVMPELYTLFAPPRQAGARALEVLQCASGLSGDSAVRFAALVHRLAPNGGELEPLRQLCRRLGVPREHRDLALCVAAYRQQSHSALTLNPTTLLHVLTSLDAFRRPQRFANFLLCCEADARSTDPARADYPQAQLLRAALEACLAVQAATLVKQGWKGKQLGEQLQQRRIQALQQLPKPSTSEPL